MTTAAPAATSVFHFYSPASNSSTWPFKYWPDGTNSTAANTTYRGGGLLGEHFTFYRDLAQAGAKGGGAFRCPSFVASSFQRSKAEEFMHGSADGVLRCVLYTLVFDAQDGCQHANLIKKSHGTLRAVHAMGLRALPATPSPCNPVSLQPRLPATPPPCNPVSLQPRLPAARCSAYMYTMAPSPERVPAPAVRYLPYMQAPSLRTRPSFYCHRTPCSGCSK